MTRDEQLDELIARRDIYAVPARYSHALDRADLALMQSVYWPDGQDNHGVLNGNAAVFCELIVREIQTWFEVTMHAVMNVDIDVRGDEATSEAYLLAYHKVRADRAQDVFGARYTVLFGGARPAPPHHHFYDGSRYIDRLKRCQGE